MHYRPVAIRDKDAIFRVRRKRGLQSPLQHLGLVFQPPLGSIPTGELPRIFQRSKSWKTWFNKLQAKEELFKLTS